ncbi:MAG: hypothetical protein HW403_917 [Dehalococcoidia bacterium]|nr:hypothetical protein [Dehalococcoidia bacterium]
MPKVSPVPDELTKPFWDACNERRLVVQTCTACNWMQHPPRPVCSKCGSKDNLTWHEVSGRGKIHGYCVAYDSRVMALHEIQPFNLAVIELEENPAIKFLSHLPGTPTDDVPIGAAVQVTFEATHNGQLINEWQVVR